VDQCKVIDSTRGRYRNRGVDECDAGEGECWVLDKWREARSKEEQ
jgi:hypothetical protein